MNFGSEPAADSRRVTGSSFDETRRRGAVAIAHKQNQYLILRTFIVVQTASRKEGRKEDRKGGRKKGRKRERKGESLELDKTRENRGRWNPSRIGNSLFTRTFTNTHDFLLRVYTLNI